jgi:hypothetical protein
MTAMIKKPDLDALEILMGIEELERAMETLDGISLSALAEKRLPADMRGKRLQIEAEVRLSTANNGMSELYGILLRALSDKILAEAPSDGKTSIAVPPGTTILEYCAENNYLLGNFLYRMGLSLKRKPEYILDFLYGRHRITKEMSDKIEPKGFFYNLDQNYLSDLRDVTGLEDPWASV